MFNNFQILNSLKELSIILFIYTIILFAISIIKKRNDIADIVWGSYFILIALFTFFVKNNFEIIFENPQILFVGKIVVNILVLIWGVRIITHIYIKNKNKTEDRRYIELTKNWGKYFYIRSYIQIFLLQSMLASLIMLPVVSLNIFKITNNSINLFFIFGLTIWMIGFYFESRGDRELKIFLQKERVEGEILDSGLWKYTRHPNYFGEVTMWWSIYVMVVALNTNLWWTIIGPLTISFLIYKVSGVPMAEKSFEGNINYDEYKKVTPALMPNLIKVFIGK